MMGGTVGLTIGFIFGSFSILKNGAGPQGALNQLSQTMLACATPLSFALSLSHRYLCMLLQALTLSSCPLGSFWFRVHRSGATFAL